MFLICQTVAAAESPDPPSVSSRNSAEQTRRYDFLLEVLAAVGGATQTVQADSPQAACCFQTNDAQMKKPYLQSPCKKLYFSIAATRLTVCADIRPCRASIAFRMTVNLNLVSTAVSPSSCTAGYFRDRCTGSSTSSSLPVTSKVQVCTTSAILVCMEDTSQPQFHNSQISASTFWNAAARSLTTYELRTGTGQSTNALDICEYWCCWLCDQNARRLWAVFWSLPAALYT